MALGGNEQLHHQQFNDEEQQHLLQSLNDSTTVMTATNERNISVSDGNSDICLIKNSITSANGIITDKLLIKNDKENAIIVLNCDDYGGMGGHSDNVKNLEMSKITTAGTVTATTTKQADCNFKTNNKQNDANTAFLRAARAGDLKKLIEFIETKQVEDINTCNANGLNALHLAAKDGHIEIVRELLNRGASVDNATKKGNTALHIASLAGQKEVIKLLIQANGNVNVQSQNGFTPLYMAAQENHDTCVRYLLAKGANQTLATEDGFTPLAVAMQQGHDKVVAVLLESDSRGKVRLPALHIAAKKDDCKAATLLLENEHNPDVASKSGFTPLHIAAHYGNVNIAELLLLKSADVNYAAKHNITPLHVACKWGKTNMVELLIAHGAKLDSTTRDGLTPLHCAARSGHDIVIDMLLENNAPILFKTKNGLAPLHMAAQGEHVDAARILLYHRAPVDEVTVDYLTALHVASHCGHVRVAKLLLDRNADPNARALNGFTPLHIACKKNRIKVVELLLKHGASISATTESGLTPLHVASFMGCMNIVIYLLQHEANPDVPTVRGETPLHLAARANQTDIIRILLRNGAQVDARAREEQTPLHVASRLGNVDIAMLLLQHGANIDAETKDLYTPLHIAAKEGQNEVSVALIENGANLNVITKKGFTPLHLTSKYGNLRVAELLLQKGAKVDAQGKNGVTPLHVASHYDNQQIALLLLDKGASPHASAKNGHTPLHIAAKKNQMEIATTLLQYGAQAEAESKSGFTPLHLSSQEGHAEMSALLIEHQANTNHVAKNGLTPLHLCAQEDEVPVANILLKSGSAKINATTKSGYTPLHIAAHYGQVNMVRFLLENDAAIDLSTNIGYTPLHQAAQQGQILVINLLLKHKANPNAITNSGQTALNIANRLGYITVVESLKIITETSVVNNKKVAGNIVEEKYRVAAPESIHETFMSDSEDECGEDPIMSDHRQYKYMTVDEMKTVPDNQQIFKLEPKMLTAMTTTMGETGGSDGGSSTSDRRPNSIFGDEYSQFNEANRLEYAPKDMIVNQQPYTAVDAGLSSANNPFIIHALDNVDIIRNPIHVGFLVSFLVDARGGAMRGCRHSGIRVIVPPQSAAQPTRITCRYVRPQRTPNPPPLMEGEALVSRILELGPVGAKFLGSVIIEVPHFASLRGKEREIIILRSDNGETWREHSLFDSEEAIHDVLNDSFEGDELGLLEDLHTNRITRVVTNDFPHFFAVVSRIRQEVHAIGSDGGTVSSTAVSQVQAVFPQNALTKKIRVGLQAQPIDANITAKLLGRGVAVSPVVTVEPRRRKFHKAITLSMPAPRAHRQGMINQYSGNAPTLRLLCSITGGQNRAIWEDVTGSTPLTFVKECVSFTTTVSARFWLMDCRNIGDASKMATELYTHMAYVPFMVKFVVFAKRIDVEEAKLSVFCMTDDKEDKTLEQQEHFTEVAKSCDVEILEARPIYLEFAGNIIPIMKSGEQISMKFNAFKENRLTFIIRVKDHQDSSGIIGFMNEPRVAKGEASQTPICTLNILLPDKITTEEQNTFEYHGVNKTANIPTLIHEDSFGVTGLYASFNKTDEIHKADIRLSDICNLLCEDWEKLAHELEVPQGDVDLIKLEYSDRVPQQAMVMLRLWIRQSGKKATGNTIEQALHRIQRSDIVKKCIFNLELVTDEMERAVAKLQLDQSGFDNLKEELGPSRDTSLKRHTTIDLSYYDSGDRCDNFDASDDTYAKSEGGSIASHLQRTIDMDTLNEKNKIPPTAEPEATDLSLCHQRNDNSEESFDESERNLNTIISTMEQEQITEAGDHCGVEETTYHYVKLKSVHKDNTNSQDCTINRKSNQKKKDVNLEEFGAAIDVLMDKVGKMVNVTRDNTMSDNKLSDDIIIAKVKENFIQTDRNRSNSNEIFKIRPFGGTTPNTTFMTETSELLNDTTISQIPVAAKTSTPIKIKTIKKHSKVPRDIIKNSTTVRPAVGNIEWDLAKDRDWDDDCEEETHDDQKLVSNISTSRSNLKDVRFDELQSTQPILISPNDDLIHSTANNNKSSTSIEEADVIVIPASKIPIKVMTFCDKTFEFSSAQGDSGAISKRDAIYSRPHSQSGRTISNTSGGINSDSDSDSHCETPLDPLNSNQDNGRANQRCAGDIGNSIGISSGGRISSKTLGSSSGSDIALHEAGIELSEDETENDFYQQNEQYTGGVQDTSVSLTGTSIECQQPLEQQSAVIVKTHSVE